MIPAGCETDILRRLAEMPFLDRLELVALCRRSRSAVYGSMDRLAQRGMVQAILHASELTSPTRRYCLTAEGLGRAGGAWRETSPDELLACRPVSARWRRVLLERLDGLAVIYRVAAALDSEARPLDFQWYRAGPADAGITLPGGRTLAVVRLGNTADRTAFAKRLWRLSEEARPDALLLLAPDEVRLRQVSRMLDSTSPCWASWPWRATRPAPAQRPESGAPPPHPFPWTWARSWATCPPRGELPGQGPARRETIPRRTAAGPGGRECPRPPASRGPETYREAGAGPASTTGPGWPRPTWPSCWG